MKLKVEGTPEELLTKGPELVKSLARRLGVDILDLINPDDLLEKAQKDAPRTQVTLRHQALRGMHELERQVVRETYKAMVEEIGRVLDQGTTNASDT